MMTRETAEVFQNSLKEMSTEFQELVRTQLSTQKIADIVKLEAVKAQAALTDMGLDLQRVVNERSWDAGDRVAFRTFARMLEEIPRSGKDTKDFERTTLQTN